MAVILQTLPSTYKNDIWFSNEFPDITISIKQTFLIAIISK